MGSAQYPRIYFNGYQYWNPNTVNNNDYGGSEPYGINTWDVPHARFDREYLQSKGVERPSEIPSFLETNIPYEPPERLIPPAEWGLYGGMQCGFVTDTEPTVEGPFSVPSQKTLTTGYTDASGVYGNQPSVEPWVGQPLQLKNGKLVDVNPMSFWSSQVIFNKFTLGDDSTGFDAKPVARMHSRFISTAKRNYNSLTDLVIAATYGATFQTCFAKETVTFNGTGGPLQQQITDAFNQGAAGLMLRYSAYATLYFQGSAFAGMDPGDRYPMLEKMGELYQEYTEDPSMPTPISRAYSRVAGWVGLWMPGELASVPGGRFLIPYDQELNSSKSAIEVTPRGLTAGQYQSPPPMPPNTDAPISAPQALGPATVEVVTDQNGDAERFTLDLSNTFPERDSTGLKADFGTVKFGLQASSGTIQWISENVPYGQATYEQLGGLIDLPGGGVTAAQLLDGSFVLQVESGQDSGSTAYILALVETLATSQTDPRGLYAEQPDPSFDDGDAPSPGPGMPSTSPTCELQVRYRGYAPDDYPSTSKPQMKLSWQAFSYTLDSYPDGEIPIEVNYKNSGGTFVPFPDDAPIDVPGDGSVEVQVVSKGSAIPNLVFLPWAESQGGFSGAPFMPPTGIGSSYYTVIKCLNWDNQLAEAFDAWLETSPPIEAVTAVVWKIVFEVYHYGFPVMNQFIDSPASFQAQADSVQQVTDPTTFDKGNYMPVTRTWAGGQRHIMNSYVTYLNSGAGSGANANADAPRFRAPRRRGLIEKPGKGQPGVNLGHG